MPGKSKGITLVTPVFRVSFPKVFKPEYNKQSKRDEYSVVALFDPTEKLTAIKEAMMTVAKEAWGPDPKKWPKKWKNPIKDQAVREKENDDGTKSMPDGYVKGAYMITAKSKNKPGVVDGKKMPIEDEENFYAGCYARANVYINTYDIDDGLSVGVSVSLNHLQKVKDGEPFSGRRKAEECFEAIADESADDAPESESEENPFG